MSSNSKNVKKINIVFNPSGKPLSIPYHEDDLLSLRQLITKTDLGYQTIGSQPVWTTPFQNTAPELPHLLSFMGQKFSMDAFALQKVVSKITYKTKTLFRKMPTALDVAYSVFHNDHVVNELSSSSGNYSLPLHYL